MRILIPPRGCIIDSRRVCRRETFHCPILARNTRAATRAHLSGCVSSSAEKRATRAKERNVGRPGRRFKFRCRDRYAKIHGEAMRGSGGAAARQAGQAGQARHAKDRCMVSRFVDRSFLLNDTNVFPLPRPCLSPDRRNEDLCATGGEIRLSPDRLSFFLSRSDLSAGSRRFALSRS